ncbi:MAG: EamA family transporter [Actinobacteria bacterium]|nr:EamA family transporter [Actinomycetota bacterium]
MDTLWIPITLAAATFQVLRTSRQHQLRSVLSTTAAGFVRYLYATPLVIGMAVLLFGPLGHQLPAAPRRFWLIITAAGLAQIFGTVALLTAFKLRDFSIGTVYAKSEVLLIALVSAFGLGEPLTAIGWAGAGIVTVGVAWLASRGSLVALLRRAGDRAALAGIAAAGSFAVAAVGIRGAALSLSTAPAFDRALVTLTVMLTIQTLGNGVYFAITDRREITAALAAWRDAIPVGVLSLLGSIGWAWAVTLENAAKVRTLGQVELVIVFLIGKFWLHERHNTSEYLASALVLIGVTVVTMFG